MNLLKIRRALLSVTDKKGLDVFARFLVKNGVEIVSTGGTARFLQEADIPVTQIDEVTGFPEILGGRVKTLHPKVHGGILADKGNPSHLQTIAEHGIKAFDLVCVNLYDFKGALDKKLDVLATIEEIDIGGPCLLRASAKNHHSVLVLPSTEFYQEAKAEMEKNDMMVALQLRCKTAAAAFALTSSYDAAIASWLSNQVAQPET